MRRRLFIYFFAVFFVFICINFCVKWAAVKSRVSPVSLCPLPPRRRCRCCCRPRSVSLPFYTHSFNSSEKGASPVSAAAAIRQSCVFPAPTADGGAGSSPSLGVDTVTVSPRRPYIPLLQSFLKLYVLAVLWRPFEFAVQVAIFVVFFSSPGAPSSAPRFIISRSFITFLCRVIILLECALISEGFFPCFLRLSENSTGRKKRFPVCSFCNIFRLRVFDPPPL